MASIFNDDAMAQVQKENEQPLNNDTYSATFDDDEDDGGFDIMALIKAESERLNNSSPIDMMEAYGEEVIELTLEELIQYNKSHT